MSEKPKLVVRSDAGALLGPLWFMGWLFTIGCLSLSFWKGALALIVWPYFLGVAFKLK